MKKTLQAASNWVMGLFLSDVDAGACLPSYCCSRHWKTNCAGRCVVYVNSGC